MDKLPLLKSLITNSYARVVNLAQKGHCIDKYHDIREAMLAINMLENFTIPLWSRTTIIDFYLRKLNTL